jgi:hypothetical protein
MKRRYLRMRKKGSIKLVVTVFMAISVALFLPGLGLAGSLEPSGPPAPTMKTLDQIPPTWDQVLPASERFVLVMSGDGVLDKETGLIWERFPSTSTVIFLSGRDRCVGLTTGERLGWRLPTLQELASLVDPTVPLPGPRLPSGHPFSGVQSQPYWTANSAVESPGYEWLVNFGGGNTVGQQSILAYSFNVWCVRGGQGVDAQ